MNLVTLSPTSQDTTVHAAESVEHSTGAAHGGGNIFSELIHHVHDSRELDTPFGHIHLPEIHLFGMDLSITKHVLFLMVAALLLVVLTLIAARQNRKNLVPRGLGNLIEIVVVFIRDEIVLPTMGKSGLRYLPFILTVFFFILTMNLLGMFPYGASATGNISVTAALSFVSFLMIQIASIRAQGLTHYLAHFTGGAPWWMWIITVPIEFLGIFTKPLALCIRLFANMTAGHIAIVSILGLIFLFKNVWIIPIPIALALGVNLLELFVAFLQAYVFTMLTSLFMGFGIQAAEHSEAAHGH